jgi:OMF family outer membrane factor
LTVVSSLAAPVAAAPKAPAAGGAGLSRSGSQAALLQLPEALPLAPALKGDRPKSNPKVLPPAATTLPPELRDLVAPASLALPDRPRQVRITQLRPLSLDQVEILAEVNNPDLKAIASQVEQAQSDLRAKIALWYPQLGFNTSSFPTYTAGRQLRSGLTGTGEPIGTTLNSIWRMQAALQASWSLIDPTRTPQIAIARDQFEKAKNQYLIGLRDLRLQASLAYFDLQTADNQVQIGQEGVRASLVSLRDARARFQAGVATKLEVLEAETQLARDQQLLTNALLSGTPGQPGQATARRALAALLDLPQDVTPTAADPARVIGTWLPSLQESIVASFTFREELDQILLDISIANSSANAELGRVQPFLKIVNNFGFGRTYGFEFSPSVVPSITGWNVDNTVGLNLNWTIYDGGSAQANYRGQKQKAQENRFLFAQKRNTIRADVERSFYELDKNNRNILTTSREVISTRESLRLARLRFQAGVTTQREVVDTQRDLTQAEVRYSNAISDYNRALVELRRRTGLDQIATCEPPRLPANKPVVSGATDVPVEPLPLVPACPAARAQLPPAANRR